MALTTITTALSLAALTGISQGWPLTNAAITTAPRSENCDCYKATADSTAYFANRKFFDFRNIANPRTPSAIAGGQDPGADAAAGQTHPYFATAAWSETWGIQNWETAGEGVRRVNSANNIYVAASDSSSPGDDGTTHLTMRTQRFSDYQSTAEVESQSTDYQYLTVRMRARTRGASGAVTALFTYKGSEDPNLVQEADIEIRTLTNATVVQYTNQPGTVDGEDVDAATRIASLPSPWTEWQEHRYDWTPGSSDWFVDGEKVASIQYQTPTNPLSVILNVWSDGGIWSGVMGVGETAQMDIQWIDLTYNTGASQTGTDKGACENVCVIDDLI
ncbi:concanavalin A-like lectin/glucanase domain-containing protein [Xylariaceae sp. AK1471]|nr:concanavalin A-like lectin/glucanase domain-containing protein [Xylariaceae sp. AK1471]